MGARGRVEGGRGPEGLLPRVLPCSEDNVHRNPQRWVRDWFALEFGWQEEAAGVLHDLDVFASPDTLNYAKAVSSALYRWGAAERTDYESEEEIEYDQLLDEFLAAVRADIGVVDTDLRATSTAGVMCRFCLLGTTNARLGYSGAISPDGNRIVLGAPYYTGTTGGKVFMSQKTGTTGGALAPVGPTGNNSSARVGISAAFGANSRFVIGANLQDDPAGVRSKRAYVIDVS